MDWKQKLRYKYSTATVLEKLIAINVLAFIFTFFLKTLGFLFQSRINFVMDWLVFPSDPMEFLIKPWTVITYAFLHAGVLHILGNMLILYFSGLYFLNHFSQKRLLNYYILGALAGAAMFMLSYNLFPAFSNVGRSHLIGASASVMAVLIGIATYVPNMKVRLMFFGSLKLWWIAAFLVALDVAQIPFGNPGGHLAHLGGALIGFIYTKQLSKGTDIGKPVENVISWFYRVLSSKKSTRTYRTKSSSNKNPFKKVYKNKGEKKRKAAKKGSFDKKEHQAQIDAILDKIGKSGYDSLSKKEKDFLFNAGKDK